MKVTLVNHTLFALETLLFTKSTRLKMSGTSLAAIQEWPWEKKMDEWQYMQNTIKSSWEFVDYIFCIEGVSRAFTQQLERHRIGTSFAEQSLRAVEVKDFDYVTTGTCRTGEAMAEYASIMEDIKEGYSELLQLGAYVGDARGVLPLNISVNIVFKVNLRALNLMCAERLCVKAQGEFQDVMRAIREEVLGIHPWAEPALRVHCAQHGVCAFPSYAWAGENSCPIKAGIFNPETGRRYDEKAYEMQEGDWVDVRPLTKQQIHDLWETNRAEAKPVFRKEVK